MVNIMTTNDKLALVSEIVTPMYELGEKNHDSLCGSVFNALPDGIGFGEISALVKTVGIDGGFIVPIAARRENCLTDMENALSNDGFPTTFPAYEHFIADYAATNDIPANWVKNKLNAAYKNEGYDVPEKSTMTDWQRVMVGAVADDVDITKSEMKAKLIASGKTETSVPLAMLGMLKCAMYEINKA